MLKLLILCFVFLFSGGKAVVETDERVLAFIEIVEKDGSIYIRTSYDTRIFSAECDPKRVVAYNYYKSCIDSPDIKTKKL